VKEKCEARFDRIEEFLLRDSPSRAFLVGREVLTVLVECQPIMPRHTGKTMDCDVLPPCCGAEEKSVQEEQGRMPAHRSPAKTATYEK